MNQLSRPTKQQRIPKQVRTDIENAFRSWDEFALDLMADDAVLHRKDVAEAKARVLNYINGLLKRVPG